jgi:hypothetical protein
MTFRVQYFITSEQQKSFKHQKKLNYRFSYQILESFDFIKAAVVN